MQSARKTRESVERPRRGPDPRIALAQYERRAATYDLELALFEPLRELAIDRLALRAGDTVLDVGCGTGLSFEPLSKAVGPAGRVVGIEQSPAMIDRARHRLAGRTGRNVTLLCRPAEEARIEGCADAALFHFTHDVLQQPAALDHVVRHLKSGARVVACGLKWAPPWAVPINLFVWGAALRSVSCLRGLDRPWSFLAERVRDLDVDELLLGAVFLARGIRA
jgi:ubiquinone/menaquinone biosynthesis C-methylase UbiE